MPAPDIEITKHWSDSSETIGYAEGTLEGHEFTASWMAGEPLGAIFFDTWLDSTAAQTRAIAKALAGTGAKPLPSLV
jgi:hypothetical protein